MSRDISTDAFAVSVTPRVTQAGALDMPALGYDSVKDERKGAPSA